MTGNGVKGAIERVTTRILEDWGMMMVDPMPMSEASFKDANGVLVAQIRFRGVVSGRYRVVCPEAFAQQLSRNLLGVDDAVAEDDRDDALREMTNVLCGNFLTECYGKDTVFELATPEVRRESDMIASTMPCEQTVCYAADGVPVAVTLELDGE